MIHVKWMYGQFHFIWNRRYVCLDATRALNWYTIDLDTAQEDRWDEVVAAFETEMTALIDFLFEFPLMDVVLRKEIMKAIDKNQDAILDAMPYGDEIRGIATKSKLALDKLTFVNIAYEVMGFCTSIGIYIFIYKPPFFVDVQIVAQNSAGEVFHGRNLDFGLYPGVKYVIDCILLK